MSIFIWIGYVLLGLGLFILINYLKDRYSLTRIQSLVFTLFLVLVVSGLFLRIGSFKFNENIFLIVVFKFIIELIYNIYFLEEDYFNKEDSNVKWAIIEVILMFILNQELINKVNDIFLTGEDLKLLIWIFVLGYIYNFYKNSSLVNKVNIKSKKSMTRENIVVSYAKMKLYFDEDISIKDEKLKLIIYSIMILNNYERPKILRRFDNFIFKINGKSRKLGIMQVKSKKFITDEESIEVVSKKISKLNDKKSTYKDIFKGYDKDNSERYIYVYEELEKFCNL